MFVVGTAEVGKAAGQSKEFLERVGVGGGGGGQTLEALTEGDGEGGGQAVGKGDVTEVVTEIFGAVGEVAEPGAGGLLLPPVLKTALVPFAKVLFGNGLGLLLGKRSDDVGMGVEPFEDSRADFAFIEAAVEFVANATR